MRLTRNQADAEDLVQDAALLAHRLSKATIDGAISSLSAVLGFALREHRIESAHLTGRWS